MKRVENIIGNMASEIDELMERILKTVKDKNELRPDDLQKIYDIASSLSNIVVNDIMDKEERDEMAIAHLLATVKLLLATANIFITDNGIDLGVIEDTINNMYW